MKGNENTSHGVTMGRVHNFLAVSTDMDTLIELSADDIQRCRKIE